MWYKYWIQRLALNLVVHQQTSVCCLVKSSCVRVNVLQGARLGTHFALFFLHWLTFICSSRERRRPDGILVLEITVTRNRATSPHSHSKNIWSRWHELNTPRWFALEYPRARSTLSVVYFPFLIVARRLDRLESQAGKPGKAEVVSTPPRALVLQACRRKKDQLSIDRRSIRRYGRSLCDIRTCPPVGSGAYGTVW